MHLWNCDLSHVIDLFDAGRIKTEKHSILLSLAYDAQLDHYFGILS